MAKPRLQLTAKLRDALLSETDDWHSLTAQQSSEILDDLLDMMAKAAKNDDATTLQRVGSTAGVLIDRIKALRAAGNVLAPITTHAQAQERLTSAIARVSAFLAPQWEKAADIGVDNVDNPPDIHNGGASD